MKSIAQSNKTELKPTVESRTYELLIPKVLTKTSSIFDTNKKETFLNLFPHIVMNATVCNGSIQLLAGDLTRQNVNYLI